MHRQSMQKALTGPNALCIDGATMLTGAEIKRTREALEESQAVFGIRFGVDQSTVHRWESKGPPARGAARKALEEALPEIRKSIPAATGADAR